MKIGIDISMEVNRSEGYMIMEFKKRELFTKGVLNPSVNCRFYKHFPDYILEEIYGTTKVVGEPTICVDNNLSADDLWDLYNNHKEGIDSMIGDSYKFPTNEYEMLNMASDIDMYCGIN